MKTLTATKKILVLFIASVFVLSCSDDDTPQPFVPTNNIVEIAQQETQLTSLVTALTKYPDLVSTLSGSGNFTVFAPNNDAFADLLTAIGQTSIDDVPEAVLRNVLEYHVHASAALTSDLVAPGALAMVNGESATISINNNDVFIDNAEVVAFNAIATNGVVHIIDNVIVPPSILPIVGTIVAPAYFNKNFTTLIAAVENANTDVLSVLLGNGSGNGLTLFAPTNAAFEAAGITNVNGQDAVLTYHVVDGTVKKADLPTSAGAAVAIETFGGADFFLTNAGGDVSINGNVNVVATDIMGSNGVVHVIDNVLIPPTQNIVEIVTEFATSDPAEFTMLAAALTRANLLSTFEGDGPFTVFAPTDAAFVDAGFPDTAAIMAAEPADLVPILTHHVVKASAYVFSSDLVDGNVEMLNNQNVGISVSNLTVQDAGNSNPPANLVPSLLNVLTTNGVVHVIDKVLLPQ